MEGGTALIMLVAALFLTVGVFTVPLMVWKPAPRPFVESVLLVGGDLLVDVRNPSDRPMSCTVYNAGVALRGPATIPPGKVATYTGPSSGRDIYVDCVSGDERGGDFRIAHQVADLGQGGGSGQRVGGDQGSGGQDGGLEIRHFSCEVRRVGNRHVVRLHVNMQAVANHGVKPYTFSIDFGDGIVEVTTQDGSAYTTNHMYNGNGPYTSRLTVTDASGNMVESTLEVPGGCRNI